MAQSFNLPSNSVVLCLLMISVGCDDVRSIDYNCGPMLCFGMKPKLIGAASVAILHTAALFSPVSFCGFLVLIQRLGLLLSRVRIFSSICFHSTAKALKPLTLKDARRHSLMWNRVIAITLQE